MIKSFNILIGVYKMIKMMTKTYLGSNHESGISRSSKKDYRAINKLVCMITAENHWTTLWDVFSSNNDDFFEELMH